MIVLLLGAGILIAAAYSKWVDRWLSKTISWILDRFTSIDPQDFASLLKVTGDYEITETRVTEDNWMADRVISDLKLNEEGVLILGLYTPDKQYVGVPRGSYKILPASTLVMYGKKDRVQELAEREASSQGENQHHAEKKKHQQELQEQDDEVPSDVN